MSFDDGIYKSGEGFGDTLKEKYKGRNVKSSVYTNELLQYLNSLDQYDINTQDTGGIEIGRLYFYYYSASTPGLKYYDTQPLTYVTDINFKQGYFIGANLHYLNPKHREGVAKTLINKGRTIAVPRQTIHRYMFSGVSGGFMRVPEKDWPSVASLPAEKFIDNRGQPFPKHRAWNKS